MIQPQALVVIPARYGSSRFPGKPLATIRGITMIERMWNIGVAAVGADRVVVATDDDRIVQHVHRFGGRALLTPIDCKNGTERVYAACKLLETTSTLPDSQVVVNLQGDAVLTPPWIVRELVEYHLGGLPSIAMATPAVRLTEQELVGIVESKGKGEVGTTFVVVGGASQALYFSKQVIPFRRVGGSALPSALRHIGLYSYTWETLERMVSLPESPLEAAEGLEQLRALENGISVSVVEVSYRGRSHASVDSYADVARVEALLERDGEL